MRKLEIIVSVSKTRISGITFMFVLYVFINKPQIKKEIYIKAGNSSIYPQ